MRKFYFRKDIPQHIKNRFRKWHLCLLIRNFSNQLYDKSTYDGTSADGCYAVWKRIYLLYYQLFMTARRKRKPFEAHFFMFWLFWFMHSQQAASYPLSNLTIYYEGYLKNILWGSKKYKKISSKHIEYFANLYRMRIKYLESMVKDEVHFILCNIWSISKSEQWQYAVTARFSLSKWFSRGHRNKFPWKK